MSEKRFEIMWGTVWMVDEDGEEELWNPQIVKILNKQQAEIDYLKDMITAMKLDIKNAMQMVSRWNDE